MDLQEAISKATRLLRLAKSDNMHEAASAAAKAQAIIDKYKIGAIALEMGEDHKTPVNTEPIINFGDEAVLDRGKAYISSWRIRLAATIAHANQCRIYLRGPAINLVGRPSDAETVRYLYAWLSNETDRLASLHGKGYGKVWSNNFRLGVVDALKEKLEAERIDTRSEMINEAGSSPAAIVRVDQAMNAMVQLGAAVQEWMDLNMNLKKASPRPYQNNNSARQAGYKAGQSISLNSSKGALGGGRHALKG